MSQVEILLSEESNSEEKLDAVINLIETYDLPLTQEEIIKVFDGARMSINEQTRCGFGTEYHEQYKFLFDTLLSNNKNMFVALTKTYINGTIFKHWYFTVLRIVDFPPCSKNEAAKIYYELLDYYEFDVDDLVINEDVKLLVQQYRHEKYGGKLTKVAIKKEL